MVGRPANPDEQERLETLSKQMAAAFMTATLVCSRLPIPVATPALREGMDMIEVMDGLHETRRAVRDLPGVPDMLRQLIDQGLLALMMSIEILLATRYEVTYDDLEPWRLDELTFAVDHALSGLGLAEVVQDNGGELPLG